MKNRREFLKQTAMTGIALSNVNMLHQGFLNSGQKRTTNNIFVENAIATLEDGSEHATPYWRIESGRDGPSLLMIAAQHGNEVQGAEVARRFMEICAGQLVKGTVWLIPMAELRGIRIRRYTSDSLPEKRVMDTVFHSSWPGDPKGHNTERIAYSLDQSVVRHCSHAVDMHCWTHVTAPETLSTNNHMPSYKLGEVTTTKFISYREGSVPDRDNKLMFGHLMFKRGITYTVMELSGQYQMRESQIRIGLSSMVNIAKHLEMIEGKPELANKRVVKRDESSHQVLAPCSGLFVPALKNGTSNELAPEDYVKEGDSLGHIIRDNDLSAVPVIAPVSGIIWRYGVCHWGQCDASLPAQHPYTEEAEPVSVIVTS